MNSTRNLFKRNQNTKPYKGFKDLPVGNHKIISFSFVKNKFYSKKEENSLKRVLLAEMEDQILFLPKSFAYNFQDDDRLIKAVNTDGIKRFLCFRGASEDNR